MDFVHETLTVFVLPVHNLVALMDHNNPGALKDLSGEPGLTAGDAHTHTHHVFQSNFKV